MEIYEKIEFLSAHVKDFDSNIKITFSSQDSSCVQVLRIYVALFLSFYVLQLTKYAITLNSPSAQTSSVCLWIEVVFEKCSECLNIICLGFHDWVVNSLLQRCLTPWAQWKKCYFVVPTSLFSSTVWRVSHLFLSLIHIKKSVREPSLTKEAKP